jgi:Bacterial SH3 domain
MIGRVIGLAGLAFSLMGGVAIAAPVPNAPQGSESVFWDSYDVAGGTVSRYIANQSGWQYVDQTLYSSLFITTSNSSDGTAETQLVQANCDSGQARTYARAIGFLGSQGQPNVSLGRTDSWYGLREGSPMVMACNQARESLNLSRSRESLYQGNVSTPSFNANARIDGDANIRTGASTTSRVITKTKRSQSIQVHSYTADGDWAYITTSDHVVGWTSEVNILQD